MVGVSNGIKDEKESELNNNTPPKHNCQRSGISNNALCRHSISIIIRQTLDSTYTSVIVEE